MVRPNHSPAKISIFVWQIQDGAEKIRRLISLTYEYCNWKVNIHLLNKSHLIRGRVRGGSSIVGIEIQIILLRKMMDIFQQRVELTYMYVHIIHEWHFHDSFLSSFSIKAFIFYIPILFAILGARNGHIMMGLRDLCEIPITRPMHVGIISSPLP